MISETKRLLKGDGINFECEPLGKLDYRIFHISSLLYNSILDNDNGDCLEKWSRYGYVWKKIMEFYKFLLI